MRVLFYHPEAHADGGARVFATAARGLVDAGWDTLFVTRQLTARTDAIPPAAALATAAGVPVVTVPPATSLVGATAELSRAVRTHMAEVVFVHGARAQVIGAGAVWRAGRSALIRRVRAGETLVLAASERAALRMAPTGFLCTWPEQATRVPARARLGAIEADLGVAERALAGEGRGTRVRCVLGPGAELRAALVLRAVAMIAPRHRDLELTLVGPGAREESLQLHAAALGIGNRVVALDRVATSAPDPDVVWVVADGDAGALGVLEAMAAGIPVLAERGTVAARYVADQITGLLVTHDDVPPTAALLARLLGHPETRAGMGAAAQSRARRLHAEAVMIDGFARAAGMARDRARWRG